MKVFIPHEIRPDENRVAAIPETVKKMIKAGLSVAVESGAGRGAHIDDKEYEGAGATIASSSKEGYGTADVVLKIQPPRSREDGSHEVDDMKEGAILVASLVPNTELDLVKRMAARKISCFSTNLIPRITIAQKMDTLSSQASLAGYKAVLMAADHLGKYFPLLMTAAGTIHPSKVVILGAGVAGLQAIATAKRLGAQVEASDIRSAVKEQIESLGAKFIEVEPDADMEDEGGYAKEASEDYLRRQREEVARRIAQADVVITTALVPGKKAPVLVTEDMVKSMHKGSVIVDLAVEQGGNCALTEPGIHVKEGVTIIGEPNIASLMAVHASQVFARNLWNLIDHIRTEDRVDIDLEEPITDGSLLTHQGEVRHAPTAELLEKGA